MINPMESSIDFPDPRNTLADGLLVIGGGLDAPTLYAAYSRGIFPWPQVGLPMLWFSPESRRVLFFKDFHVPESLRRHRNKHPQIEYRINQNFSKVMTECAQQTRPGQVGTWISEEMVLAYTKFFEEGYALCVEVWEGTELIGGIYGVLVGGVFSGESMFYKTPNASKLAFWRLIEILQKMGHEWIDVQMVTPVVASFGGKYIAREEYLKMLRDRQSQK